MLSDVLGQCPVKDWIEGGWVEGDSWHSAVCVCPVRLPGLCST